MKISFVDVAIFLVLFVVYFSIDYILYHQYDFINQNLLFFAEKALLAIQGKPPRLENIGLVYPPLSFLPFLIFRNPIFTNAVVSALINTYAIRIFRIYILNIIDTLFLAFIMINPIYLYFTLNRFDILLYTVLISTSFYNIMKHFETGYSIYLFYSGLIYGATFFIDFRSILILPIFILLAFYNKDKDIYKNVSIFIVALTPIIFFLFGWMFLNYLFASNPLFFLKSQFSFLKSFKNPNVLSLSGSLYLSFLYTIDTLIRLSPAISPYLINTFIMIKNKYKAVLIHLSPIFLMVSSVYLGYYYRLLELSLMFLVFSIFEYVYFTAFIQKRMAFVLILASMISFILSFYAIERYGNSNQKFFIKHMLGISKQKYDSVYYYKKTAEELKKLKCKNILADDATDFELVYFYKKPKNLILPYNYEYNSVLAYPSFFADCVLVYKLSKNLISNAYKNAPTGHIKHYELIYENKYYNIFKRSGHE